MTTIESKVIKVLIVDDSALIRLLLTEILTGDKQIQVVGVANDPYEAREKIKQTQPDVITLDVEMPKMDGISFLANLMRLHPLPVVMISSKTSRGAETTLKALELGAVDFIHKPDSNMSNRLIEYSELIIEKVKAAAQANIDQSVHKVRSQRPNSIQCNQQFEIIAIGASTGGVDAIKNIVTQLPDGMPPIVVVQHIPPFFSTSFAKRLAKLSDLRVIEVDKKLELEQGGVYIAPGDDHVRICRRNGQLFVNIDHSERVNRHRPSVDVLFDSVAEVCGKRSIGVILTGMGDDGANGLARIKAQGGITIAQDKESSVVWGMPGTAVKRNAVTKVLSLKRISTALMRMVSEG